MHLKESFIFKLFLLLEVFTTNFLFHLNLGKKGILDLDLVATNKKNQIYVVESFLDSNELSSKKK